jgi:multisubunit Na+/H+ antiporter MnhC subunit
MSFAVSLLIASALVFAAMFLIGLRKNGKHNLVLFVMGFVLLIGGVVLMVVHPGEEKQQATTPVRSNGSYKPSASSTPGSQDQPVQTGAAIADIGKQHQAKEKADAQTKDLEKAEAVRAQAARHKRIVTRRLARLRRQVKHYVGLAKLWRRKAGWKPLEVSPAAYAAADLRQLRLMRKRYKRAYKRAHHRVLLVRQREARLARQRAAQAAPPPAQPQSQGSQSRQRSSGQSGSGGGTVHNTAPPPPSPTVGGGTGGSKAPPPSGSHKNQTGGTRAKPTPTVPPYSL